VGVACVPLPKDRFANPGCTVCYLSVEGRISESSLVCDLVATGRAESTDDRTPKRATWLLKHSNDDDDDDDD
jgi:hypothetical protein